jgi:uncharacterized paraquat-inducible protein A
MVEYIEREALLATYELQNFPWVDTDERYEIARKFPTADVVEVRHGKWKQARYTEAPLYICSECDKTEYKQHNYCPNCGAKMDGKGDAE